MAEEPRARAAAAQDERDLLEGCLEALRKLVPAEIRKLAWEPARTPQPDALLELELDGQGMRHVIEVKRHLRPAHVGPLVHFAKQLAATGDRLLVCADRVPDGVGRQLRQHEVAYLDLGGNAYLRGPNVYVLITGRHTALGRRGRRDLTGTEVRLLGVFLRDQDAGEAVQEELATRAGIALGAVGQGREKLLELRILELTGKRQWRVVDRAEGLRRFAEGWGTVVRHKLRPRAYRPLMLKGPDDLERRLKVAGPKLGCLLGGERAAGHLTAGLRTEHATLHVPPGTQRNAAKALKLVPDVDGPITLLERFGLGDECRFPDLPGVPLVHPLLVWAECLTVPDERVAQVARELRDQLLEGPRG